VGRGVTEKTCRACGETKSLIEFHKDKRNKDGLCGCCKPCNNARTIKWQRENREKYNAKTQRHYHKDIEAARAKNRARYHANPEAHAARSRAWIDAHPEQYKAMRRRYYEDNLERERAKNRERFRSYDPGATREKQRQWRAKNPERVLAWSHARRIKLNATPLADEDIEYIGVLRCDPCSYCGERPTTIDHIVAVHHGGGNEWGNLTAACKRCNASNHTRSLLEYLMDPLSGKDEIRLAA
jgi:5-methylcytosine-specific restriction endonuclease McrA